MKTLSTFITVAVLMLSQTLTAQTWNLQTSNTMRNLWDVYFFDDNNGLVCGDSGTILRTTDGGANWTSVNSGTTDQLAAVFFVNSNVGYLGGWLATTGTLLKTTDGGNNWSNISLGIPNIRSGGIWFTSGNTGFYAYGDETFSNSKIMKTTDGGSTWNNVYSGSGWLSLFYFTDANNGFATVSGSTLLRTTNGGSTWDSLNVGGNLWMSGIHFFNKDTGIAGGAIYQAAGSLFKTTNGGNTWQNLTNQYGASRIIFPTSTTGYVIGNDSINWDNKQIIKTTDGGNNWTFESTPRGKLNSIFFPSTNIGFAVGDNGTILNYTGTTDVSNEPTSLPAFFGLSQNYPNPFNPTTTVSYQLPTINYVTLKVFDILGREVATLVDGVEVAGDKSVQVNGRGLASGMYLYQLRAGAFVSTKKFLLLR